MTVRARLREIAEGAQTDPKKALLDSLQGLHETIIMAPTNVLCATYIGPEKTRGGIIRPDRNLLEDRFQGKAFLVLRLGALAFADNPKLGVEFGGFAVKEGEWVMAKPSSGYELYSVDGTGGQGTPCRIFRDVDIFARIDNPALIY